MLKKSVAICISVALWAGSARADDQETAEHTESNIPKPGWAMLAGAATAIVPLAVAGPFFGNTFDTTERRDAIFGIMSGLTLAPIVSHLVEHEWSRAAIFGAIPLACLVGEAVLLELQPSADLFGTPQGRTSFGVLLSVATLSSGLGIVDALGATQRAAEKRKRKQSITGMALPFGMPRGAGITAGGAF